VKCQRCGAPNEPGDKFCGACGATLDQAAAPSPAPSREGSLARLLGATRRARLLTAGTAAMLCIAIAAFIALKPTDDTIPRDAYTVAADRMCVAAKRRIVAIERRYEARGRGDVTGFARELVPVVGSWRARFRRLRAPGDRVEQATAMQAALLEAEARIAGLARAAATGDRESILASARQADAASAAVEEAAESLGLGRCAQAQIVFSPTPR